jgi:hypothetical protein
MIQPQYSPQEALEKMKLMMKYDTSKTLNENVETIKPINEALPAIPVMAYWIGGSIAAATGLGTWLYDVQRGGSPSSKVQSFFQGCSSMDKNLKPTLSKSEHRAAADAIFNALEGGGTDEDAIKSALASMETVADLCAMHKYYNRTYGDLYEDIDGDIDGSDWMTYVWSPISGIVDDAEEDLEKVKEEEGKKKDDGKKTDDGKKKTGGGGTGYKPCSGTYSFGCKSDVIAKVQACIGTVADGKFGPKTKAALTSKGFSTFTDADVEKICTTVVKPKDEFVTQVDADDAEEILNT